MIPVVSMNVRKEDSVKILVAEDEPDLQKIIRMYLEKEGYQVDTASDGEEAWEKLCLDPYDLLIADWMMPKKSGLELCREARSYSMPLKIIMLTVKSDVESEIAGLRTGADDYIRKPFEPRLLLLRVRKLLKLEEILRCGNLTLDQKSQTVTRCREEIRLTQKEYLLLQILMEHVGQTLSREQLLTRVWGDAYDGDERTLDTHIKRLRGKIGKETIKTFVGMGYRLEEHHE